MKVGDIVKNAPNAIIWAVVIVFLGVVAAFVTLAVTGSSSDDFRSFLNTVLNIGALVLSGGGVVAASAAAKSAHQAVQQTNGLADAERADIAKRAASEALAALPIPVPPIQ